MNSDKDADLAPKTGRRYDGFWKALNDQVRSHEMTIEALRRAEQKYRGIFENAVEGIFQTSPDGRYLCANPALARMYGYETSEELMAAFTDIGRQLYVNPQRREEFQRLLRDHEALSEFESQVFTRNGSVIWISENARVVRDELSGAVLYYEGMVQDITDRKRAEEIARRAEALKAAQYDVTRTLAESTYLREAAGRVMRAICEGVDWDFGDLWRLEAGALRCVDLWHSPELNVAEFAEATRRKTFIPGLGLPGRVWATGQAVWMRDVTQDRNFARADIAAQAGLHGAFAFPVKLGGAVVGVMELFSRQIREPDDDLLVMLTTLSTQIGQFIERERIASQLAHYAEELRTRNAEMEADLAMARDIQRVFLAQSHVTFPPDAHPDCSSLQFYTCYRPAAQVSGDFFSVLPLSATEAGVFICDVIGHGMRAALVTAIVRGLLEEMAPVATDPGRFLTEINRSLLRIFRQTETPMLASAFYLIADTAEGMVRFSNAGHPHPFHVRRGCGVVERMRVPNSHGPVLGVLEEAAYRTGCCPMSAGDLVVLFTDGVYEVDVGNEEYFGEERLRARVHERMALTADKMFDALLSEIQQASGGKEFEDDVCLLGVEVAGSATAAVCKVA